MFMISKIQHLTNKAHKITQKVMMLNMIIMLIMISIMAISTIIILKIKPILSTNSSDKILRKFQIIKATKRTIPQIFIKIKMFPEVIIIRLIRPIIRDIIIIHSMSMSKLRTIKFI